MRSKKLSRRDMLKLSSGVIAASWLSACVPDGGGSDSTSSASEQTVDSPEAEQVSVRVQASANPNALEHFRWVAERHMAENPNVEIVIEETIYGEIAKKTETGFVAGTLQDICYGHMRWYFSGCNKGIYLNVEDLIAATPPDDFEDFFPRWMEVNKFEGQQYQLPHYSKPGPVSSLIYNKQILEEAGVEEPNDDWTWLDLYDAALKCTDEDNGVFGINYRFLQNDIHSTTNVCRYFEEDSDDDTSGSLMVDDGTRFRMDTDTIREAMDYTLSLAHDHRAFPLAGDAIDGGLFAAGKLAFEVGQVVNNYIANLQRVDGRFEIGHVISPQGPKGARGTVNVGNQLMINSKSEVIDAAWQFMHSMTSKEACVESALKGIEPGRRSAWIDPKVVEVTPILAKSVHLMDEYLEDFPMPSNLRYVEANSVFKNEVALIMEGEVSFDEYMPTVVEEVQAIVDLERP